MYRLTVGSSPGPRRKISATSGCSRPKILDSEIRGGEGHAKRIELKKKEEMQEKMIEALELQNETREVYEMLQRIHELPESTMLPASDIQPFMDFARLFFSGDSNYRCIFRGPGCHVELRIIGGELVE